MKRASVLCPLPALLAAFALAGPACTESPSPTETSAVRPTPAAVPSPTQVPVAPASMAGRVLSYGPLEPGVVVECQGRRTIASNDGAYSIDGLVSGPATAQVTYGYATREGIVTDTADFPVVLRPGANSEDFLVF